MPVSKRAAQIGESLTLALNAKALELARQGLRVYNLTAGQTPLQAPRHLCRTYWEGLWHHREFPIFPCGRPAVSSKKIDRPF